MLSDKGVIVEPINIEIVVRWPVSDYKTKVRRFLGFITYTRKYVRNFAKIAAPIMDLLKDKFERITWTCNCHENFEALKIALKKARVLRFIDPLKCGIVLCTNANDMAIDVVLMQKKGDRL